MGPGRRVFLRGRYGLGIARAAMALAFGPLPALSSEGGGYVSYPRGRRDVADNATELQGMSAVWFQSGPSNDLDSSPEPPGTLYKGAERGGPVCRRTSTRRATMRPTGPLWRSGTHVRSQRSPAQRRHE